ncbi:MAG: universal stress protein [Anaerolineales bacterium]|nr:universal stress protein [Anaerolineales bacterium]
MSFDEVIEKLKLLGSAERGLKDIPLDAIIGSVGRYTDFTRDFLPRREVNPERWARVKIAASGLVGLPPIVVYQIGESYFVIDGNHRVSVARQFGATHIQAYVTEMKTRVPLTPDVKPDDLILKAEYSNFLEQTRIDELRPGADLSVTIPGQYPKLILHIGVHRYFMGLDYKRDISYEEAVTHWYDAVYLPVIHIIRDQGILHRFPDRTETDLYLWLAEHRANLEEQLGWQIKTEYAASNLLEKYSSGEATTMSRIGSRLLEIILPEKLEPGPPVGLWRSTRSNQSKNYLFGEILVPVNGREDGWCALEQALILARREGAQIHGLHVIASDSEEEKPEADSIRAEFNRRCNDAGINGALVMATGEIARQICLHAKVTDLVVANLSYPPAPQLLARLSSGFRDLLLRCPRPILATPHTVAQLSRPLLAYDGSPKAQEALYIATYLSGKWQIPLVVVCVEDSSRVTSQTLNSALEYLSQHGVGAEGVIAEGPVGQAVLATSQAHNCDFLIMGGYGFTPVLEAVLGSSVDRVLRESRMPMLICR